MILALLYPLAGIASVYPPERLPDLGMNMPKSGTVHPNLGMVNHELTQAIPGKPSQESRIRPAINKSVDNAPYRARTDLAYITLMEREYRNRKTLWHEVGTFGLLQTEMALGNTRPLPRAFGAEKTIFLTARYRDVTFLATPNAVGIVYRWEF